MKKSIEKTREQLLDEISKQKQMLKKAEESQKQTILLNQQLIASEQQLRSANQQLVASEQQLLISEERYRTFIDNAPDAFYLSDMEGKFIDANQAACKILGYTREELLDLSIPDVDINFPKDKLAEILGGLTYNESQPVESAHRTKNGKIIHVEVQIRTFGPKDKPLLLSLARDITERKQAEKALKDSESNLRQIIDLVPHFIYVKDEAGKDLIVNKAVAEAYGTTVEKIINKSDMDITPDKESAKQYIKDDLEVINSGKQKFIPEEYITDSKGNIRFLETVKIPFNTSMTDKRAIVGVSVDITKRKQVEEDLIKRNEELELFNKMAVGRELKMIDLKKEINNLLEEAGKAPAYDIVK